MNANTKAVRGVGVEIRANGYTWMARVNHLGGGGTDYFKFNGRWIMMVQGDIPGPVYRKLREGVREAVRIALSGK